jgi:hypothetical protein
MKFRKNPRQLQLLKDLLLKRTEMCLLFFLKRHPEFWIQIRTKLSIEVDSPFHPGEAKMSIFYSEENGKWFFKEHGGGDHYGDMFSYVAFLHKMDFKRDFPRILAMVQVEMANYQPFFYNTYKLLNNETGEWIAFYR